MIKRPSGFRSIRVRTGVLFVDDRSSDRWVILAGYPDVKIDNKHRDGRPHLHRGGWNAEERTELRPNLTSAEATEVVIRLLNSIGYVDIEILAEALQ